MRTLIYIFITIDLAGALFLLFAISSNNQDPAGQGIAYLPIILLIGCGAGSYLLMQHAHLTTAAILGGLPVLVLAYLLFISFT